MNAFMKAFQLCDALHDMFSIQEAIVFADGDTHTNKEGLVFWIVDVDVIFPGRKPLRASDSNITGYLSAMHDKYIKAPSIEDPDWHPKKVCQKVPLRWHLTGNDVLVSTELSCPGKPNRRIKVSKDPRYDKNPWTVIFFTSTQGLKQASKNTFSGALAAQTEGWVAAFKEGYLPVSDRREPLYLYRTYKEDKITVTLRCEDHYNVHYWKDSDHFFYLSNGQNYEHEEDALKHVLSEISVL